MADEDLYKKLLSYSFDVLSRRDHSCKELMKKIKRKFEEEIAASDDCKRVIKKLEELGYLNDERFVEGWVRNRRNLKPRGVYLLKRELRLKGIEKDLVEEMLGTMNIDEYDDAMRFLEGRRQRLERLSQHDRRKKIMSLLANRGFSSQTVYKILHSW